MVRQLVPVMTGLQLSFPVVLVSVEWLELVGFQVVVGSGKLGPEEPEVFEEGLVLLGCLGWGKL